jgi:hypothetical protein
MNAVWISKRFRGTYAFDLFPLAVVRKGFMSVDRPLLSADEGLTLV